MALMNYSFKNYTQMEHDSYKRMALLIGMLGMYAALTAYAIHHIPVVGVGILDAIILIAFGVAMTGEIAHLRSIASNKKRLEDTYINESDPMTHAFVMFLHGGLGSLSAKQLQDVEDVLRDMRMSDEERQRYRDAIEMQRKLLPS